MPPSLPTACHPGLHHGLHERFRLVKGHGVLRRFAFLAGVPGVVADLLAALRCAREPALSCPGSPTVLDDVVRTPGGVPDQLSRLVEAYPVASLEETQGSRNPFVPLGESCEPLNLARKPGLLYDIALPFCREVYGNAVPYSN